MDQIDSDLAALASLTRAELRQKWSVMTASPAPRASAALLRLAYAYELQSRAHGGLSNRSSDRLTRASEAAALVGPPPRQRLVREWKGTLHVVTIESDETIRWNGKSCNSLSEVARAITGTRWSGPAFFGLKTKARRSA